MATTAQFTTVEIAALLDHLCEAVDAIRASTAIDNKPWMRALDKAYDYLLQVDAISYDLAAHAIRVPSATEAGVEYTANGDCACKAFTAGKGICWHRAAARLVRRALEAHETAEQNALAAELVREAHEAGCRWYGVREGLEGARARMPEVETFAAEWDVYSDQIRAAVAESRAGLAA